MSIIRPLSHSLVPSLQRALHSSPAAYGVKDTVGVRRFSPLSPAPTLALLQCNGLRARRLTTRASALQAIFHGSEKAKDEAHSQHSALVGRGVS